MTEHSNPESKTDDAAPVTTAMPKPSQGRAMIEAKGLSKYYGAFTAIEDVSFTVREGEVCAFLGPNGAGKSTTMKILTGYLSPTKGEVKLAGIDILNNREEALKFLGYLPENGPLYLDMTPRELLLFLGEARGLSGPGLEKRVQEVINQCFIADVQAKPIGKLSKGYRQRVHMAQLLLHEPDVLIMDEPTSGLDPNQIIDVRRTIRELGKNRTILLSTHILQEVEAMADKVVLINEGRIVYDGPTQELADKYHGLDKAFAKLTSSKEAA